MIPTLKKILVVNNKTSAWLLTFVFYHAIYFYFYKSLNCLVLFSIRYQINYTFIFFYKLFKDKFIITTTKRIFVSLFIKRVNFYYKYHIEIIFLL